VRNNAVQGLLDRDRVRAVAAHEPMAAEEPHVPRAGRGLARQGRGLVRIDQAEVEVEVAKLAELQLEEVLVPLGFLMGAIVGEPIGLDLGRGEPLGHVDRHRREPEPVGRHEAGVADDDHPLAVDHDRLAEAELLDGGHDLGHRGLVPARVAGVRDDLLDGDQLDLHARRHVPLNSVLCSSRP
jgi:hypothetical protein